MKIAYLIPDVGVSGGVAIVCQHANRLKRRGHQVSLVSQTQATEINWFPNQNVPVLTFQEFPEDLDILVATGWSTSFDIVDLPAKQKFYFIQSDETRFHDQDSIWQNLAALSYLLNVNYLTEARWIRKWLKENFSHEAALVPNGLDREIFFPVEPLEPKGEKPRILLEGAIALPYKGMQDAFSVVADLDVEVWCVSSLGKPEPGWHCDRFFKQIPMTEMRKVYSSCDILLKMSRVEGFFGPPLEMMACGGTSVVAKVTGYDEYIKDGYNALVVEPGDVAGARRAIQRILSESKLRDSLIQNGLETAKQWQWESSIDRLEAHFQEVLDGKAGVTYSRVRKLSDKAISISYHMARNQANIFGDWEPSAFTEPIDRILYRIRKIGWIRKFAAFIHKVYKKIT